MVQYRELRTIFPNPDACKSKLIQDGYLKTFTAQKSRYYKGHKLKKE